MLNFVKNVNNPGFINHLTLCMSFIRLREYKEEEKGGFDPPFLILLLQPMFCDEMKENGLY